MACLQLIYQSENPFLKVVKGSFDADEKSSAGRYRYAWNGAEVMDEVYGRFGTYDLGARMYNPKIGRMFSTDPREAEYAWQSPYAYYGNTPIWKLDNNGEVGIHKSKDHLFSSALSSTTLGTFEAVMPLVFG